MWWFACYDDGVKQQSLFKPPARESGPDDRVSDKNMGMVFHSPRGSIRIQGPTADGRWVAHRCSRAGKDERPPVVVILPKGWRDLT